jgi:hypothetical protein
MKKHSNTADRMAIRRQTSQALVMLFAFGVVGSLLLAVVVGTVGAQGAGNALEFDGSDDYVEANGYDIDTFSISAWVKMNTDDTYTGWEVIIEFTPAGSTMRRGLGLSGIGAEPKPYGSPTIYYGDNRYKVSESGSIRDKAWHHLVGTYDGSTPKLYVDGQQVVLLDSKGTGAGSDASRLTIGTRTLHDNYFFTGIIDEVQVWNVALEQDQIRAMMNKQITSDNLPGGLSWSDHLKGYWRLDEASGDSCADHSDNGNTGTMIDMTPSTDRVTSTAPLGTNGAFVATTDPTSVGPDGGKITITIASLGDNSSLGVYQFGSPEGEPVTAGEIFPSDPIDFDRRSNVVWGITEKGDVTADLVFDYSGQAGIGKPEDIRILKRDDANDLEWEVVNASPEPFDGKTITITGVTDFSEYALGGYLPDNPLPVELSFFTATTSETGVVLEWRTEMEVGNLGFTIYSSESQDGPFVAIGWIKSAGNLTKPHDYQFTDDNVEAGKTYFYFLEDVDFTGKKNKSEIIEVVVSSAKVESIPQEFRLLPNYPNPFNPETWLPYELAADAPVTVEIYDVNGQLVRRFSLGQQKAGRYLDRQKAAYWDGKDHSGDAVASGIYFCTLTAGDFQAIRRMVLVK